MSKIKRSENSVRNIALSAIGYKYKIARNLRRCMFISYFGSIIMQAILNRGDTPISSGIKTGMLVSYGVFFLKSLSDNRKISRDMDRYDELYNIIGRKDTSEVITVDDIEKNVCRIEFPDKAFIEEKIKDGIYSCIYNANGNETDITNKVKQLVKN